MTSNILNSQKQHIALSEQVSPDFKDFYLYKAMSALPRERHHDKNARVGRAVR